MIGLDCIPPGWRLAGSDRSHMNRRVAAGRAPAPSRPYGPRSPVRRALDTPARSEDAKRGPGR